MLNSVNRIHFSYYSSYYYRYAPARVRTICQTLWKDAPQHLKTGSISSENRLHCTLKVGSIFALWSLFSDGLAYLFRCHGASFSMVWLILRTICGFNNNLYRCKCLWGCFLEEISLFLPQIVIFPEKYLLFRKLCLSLHPIRPALEWAGAIK